ncbi:MAG: hypothetical protein ACJA1R_002863 [Flavobacteriales bacterium]
MSKPDGRRPPHWCALPRALAPLFATVLCGLAPSALAPRAAEIRWLGHDRVLDSARLGAGVATLGDDGLVITWAGESAERWHRVEGASSLVAAPTGLLVIAENELVTLDASLTEVGRQPLDGVSPCRGVDAVWWWTDAGSIDVFTPAGGARREGVVVPHGDARCGVSPYGSALAWVDASTAYLAVWSGTSIDVTSADWDTVDTPIPKWDGSEWRLASSNTVRRFCDIWDGAGTALPCRESVDDTAFAELPREVDPTWAAHLGNRLVLADEYGWSVIDGRGATRRSPAGWMTLGLLHREQDVLVIGCQSREGAARLSILRPTGGAAVESADIVGGCAGLRVWADGRGLSAVDAEGVLIWNEQSGLLEREHASGVIAQTAPLGPLGWVVRLRETWTALCGTHTAVERVNATGAVHAIELPCQRWRSLGPLFDDRGALVGATFTGDAARDQIWTFSGIPLDATPCMQSPQLPRGAAIPLANCPLSWNNIRVTATTRGVVIRDGERVWLSADLRPHAALVSRDDIAYFSDIRRHGDFDAALPQQLLQSSVR